jgi:hypothetical protein
MTFNMMDIYFLFFVQVHNTIQNGGVNATEKPINEK